MKEPEPELEVCSELTFVTQIKATQVDVGLQASPSLELICLDGAPDVTLEA